MSCTTMTMEDVTNEDFVVYIGFAICFVHFARPILRRIQTLLTRLHGGSSSLVVLKHVVRYSLARCDALAFCTSDCVAPAFCASFVSAADTARRLEYLQISCEHFNPQAQHCTLKLPIGRAPAAAQ
jgi:hypothetical protein